MTQVRHSKEADSDNVSVKTKIQNGGRQYIRLKTCWSDNVSGLPTIYDARPLKTVIIYIRKNKRLENALLFPVSINHIEFPAFGISSVSALTCLKWLTRKIVREYNSGVILPTCPRLKSGR